MVDQLDRYFGITESGSSLRIEARAGFTIFLTMSYILFVNPDILSAAIQIDGAFPQLLTATALAAAFGSLFMGIVARYPFALAPGMGLNAYFAYTVVLGEGIPWQTALGAVFLSGLLFIALSAVGVRKAVVRALPAELRVATAAGIGLFLAFIGAKNAGWIVASPATLVTLGALDSASSGIATLGLMVVGGLLARRVPGAILIGIAVCTAVAIATGAPVYQGVAFGGFSDGFVRAPAWPVDLIGALDIGNALEMGLIGIVFTFTFVDLFDTAGTLVGLGERSGLTDESGNLPNASRAFLSDAVATTFGSLLGTSTTTTYIESTAGVEAGGRTGLTAVVAGLCFALSTVFWPLASAVPAAATAPVLVLVGVAMMSGLGRVDWSCPERAVPAFLTILLMPLTFSIANGIAAGILAWVALHTVAGKLKDLSWVMVTLAAAIVVRYTWLAAA